MDLSEVKSLNKVHFCPRGYGECEHAGGCVYPGRCRAELDDSAKRLLKAADLMETRGHCRGDAEGADGSLCVIAALTYADKAFGGCGVGKSYRDAVERLRSSFEWPDTYLPGWSDEAPTQHVIAKLRAVAFSLSEVQPKEK